MEPALDPLLGAGKPGKWEEHRGYANRTRPDRDEPQSHQSLRAVQPPLRLAEVPKLHEDDLLQLALRKGGSWLHPRSAPPLRAREGRIERARRSGRVTPPRAYKPAGHPRGGGALRCVGWSASALPGGG